MSATDTEKRLVVLEARVARVESLLQVAPAPAAARAARPAPSGTRAPRPGRGNRPSLVTSILGWGGASPLMRIVSLAVLGVTFCVGGLLYQRMLAVGDG